jgi:hypothetical protein
MDYNDHFNLLLAMTFAAVSLRIYLLDFMLMEDIVGVFLQ